MTKIEELVSAQLDTRDQIAYRLASFIKLAKAKRTKTALENRLADVNRLWEECRSRHQDILNLADDSFKKTHKYFVDQVFMYITDTMDETRDGLQEHYVAMLPKPLAPKENSASAGEPVHATLPTIPLPKFDGDRTAWPSFRDLFNTLVDSRKDLNNVQKLHYLKASLQGEASRLLSNTPITDSNYEGAMSILNERYERKRAILYSHLQRMIDCPKVSPGSVRDLKTLLDLSREVRSAFQAESRLDNLGEDMFVFLVVTKLDQATRRDWEGSLEDVNLMPKFVKLSEFLNKRIGAWETSDSSVTTEPRAKGSKPRYDVTRSHQVCAEHQKDGVSRTTSGLICVCCGGTHLTYQCTDFLRLSVPQRIALMQRHQRCLNCFAMGHIAKNCPGKYRCRQCQQRHHSLLHFSKPAPTSSSVKTDDQSMCSASTHCKSLATQSCPTVSSGQSLTGFDCTVLPTASVVLTGSSGRSIEVRALLDQGSQSSFMSESLIQILKPTLKPVAVNVKGMFGVHVGDARYVANVSVRAHSGASDEFPISVLLVPKLSAYVPPPVPVAANLSHLQNLPLADRDPFSNTAIQLVIGAEYYCRLLRDGIIVGPPNSPSAQNTLFGWVLSGQLTSPPLAATRISSCHLTVSKSDCLDYLLQSFWQVEEVPTLNPLSPEERMCEDQFLKTHQRLKNGRYMVRLPLRISPPLPIGDTTRPALRTLFSCESRLEKRTDLALAYNSFLQEYEHLGHMTRVPLAERKSSSAVYLPHHPVIKESSSTTKVRVVFNASSISSNGTSLNDFLCIGSKLQTDLFAIILRWRSYKYVYAADLEKMFRQILIHPSDTDFQRIFWRSHPEEEVQEYRLSTVTYGTAPAPFLANRVIRQLVVDEGKRFPLAAPILTKEIYVDDLMFGGDDVELLLQSRIQLTDLLRAGGFRPYKWVSNDKSLLADIPCEDLSVRLDKPLGDDVSLKVLGIYWSPVQDAFLFRVQPQSGPLTKRAFLSLISRVFDPLGWITPFLISGKILMQKLWVRKVGWDQTLPNDLSNALVSFATQLTTLNQIVVPRSTHQAGSSTRLELHGFADASNSAYSAVVYLRAETRPDQVHVTLLYSKSKVAPLKLLSIPRLELCAAVLLVRAIEFVQRAMNLVFIPVICWTDSMTVLSWLQSPAVKWKVFIAHRVSKIQSSLPTATWRYVPTGDNPADCASRGISAIFLVKHPLWWRGPSWLREPCSSWPKTSMNIDANAEIEARSNVTTNLGTVTKTSGDLVLPHRFSSWSRLLRVSCYLLRFINGIKRQPKFSDDFLSANEIESTRRFLCKQVQVHEFGPIKYANGKPCLPNSFRKLSALSPFVDDEGIVRVGGRLRNSLLPFEARHPILIPQGHVAMLLARHAHHCTMHGGLRISLYFLRQQYWLINARSIVKHCIFKCVTCTRARAQCAVQLLSDLPKPRVTPSRPFTHTGVDYAGPFAIRSSKGRGIKAHKAYLVIFVCLATRAVHLEIADDYTTEGFLAAFSRFTSRRGIPSDVYSDNGSNFVGADRELSRRLTDVLKDPNLQARFAGEGLSWHFIPPSAPHFGGLWEAGVKSTKHHLKRVIGNFTPTYEEFATLLCKIECVLNSRPIGPLHDDVESLEVLTPGHLLSGGHLQLPPQPSLLDVSENRVSRWQFICRAVEAFWKNWAADYLNTVQQRGKWKVPQPNLKIGDLVLLKSNHLPPAKWALGRVAQCYPGSDGLVRVVLVRTALSEFKRPVTQLCKLPIDSNN